jgi:acetyl-CoA synthetase
LSSRVVPPSTRFKAVTLREYWGVYESSVRDLEAFWAGEAGRLLWRKPWEAVRVGEGPGSRWFAGGELSPYENVVLRHSGSWVWRKPALLWEDESGEARVVTYSQLDQLVSRAAGGLRSLGVRRGDWVVVYSPPSVEAVAVMLAAVRLGAPFEAVFTGFSARELARRLRRRGARVLVAADGFLRRGRPVRTLEAAREALAEAGVGARLVVVERVGAPLREGEVGFDELLSAGWEQGSAAVPSDHPLFGLHSGYEEDFEPVTHPAGGFLAQVYATTRWMGLRPRDTYFCTVWPGWITGVAYVVFGPLMVGSTVLLYEGGPDWPSWGRWLELIDSYAVTVFLTTSSALRMMARQDPSALRGNLDTLKAVLVTAEPLEREVWEWAYTRIANLAIPVIDSVGRGTVPVVNLYIQSEVGTFVTGNLLNYTFPPIAPGSAGPPIPGFHVDVVDGEGRSVRGAPGRLVLRAPWPSMPVEAPEGFRRRWSGGFYDTGDLAVMEDAYVYPLGRGDVVLKVSGYRLSPGAIERAAEAVPGVARAVVVGVRDELRFEVPVVVYVGDASPEEVKRGVREGVGPIAEPREAYRVRELPGEKGALRAELRRLVREVGLEGALARLLGGAGGREGGAAEG